MLIREQRLQRAALAMREEDVDMWIAYGRELYQNGEAMLRYILSMEVGGPFALILTKEGERIAVVSVMEAEEQERIGLFTKVVWNRRGLEGMKEAVTDIVKNKSPRTIALNFSKKDPTSDGLSFSGYKLLMEAFKMASFSGEIISSAKLMKKLRANRSPEEIEKIHHAVQESMKIYEEARPLMKKGMSGMDIQRLFQSIADREGYGYAWPKYGNPFNSIGTRSSYLCKRPAEDVFIEPGDVVNVDFGICVDGFASDNQRTFYALRDNDTDAPEEVKHAFETLGKVNSVLAKHMKAGIKSGEILKYANEVLAADGYPERMGGFGHEIGIFAHDGVISPGSDMCEPEVDSTLLEGMTFTLEPAIITSCGRVCREEVVAVGKDEGRILSTLQQEIWLIK